MNAGREQRSYPVRDDEARQPSDVYLARNIPTSSAVTLFDRTQLSHATLLGLYWHERIDEWLTSTQAVRAKDPEKTAHRAEAVELAATLGVTTPDEHADLETVTYGDLERLLREDLDKEVPRPHLSEEVRELYGVLGRLAVQRAHATDPTENAALNQHMAELVKATSVEAREQMDADTKASWKRGMLVPRWAWEQHNLLLFEGRAYQPTQPPPDWLLKYLIYEWDAEPGEAVPSSQARAIAPAFRAGTATIPTSLPVQGLFAALHAAPLGVQTESNQGWQQTEDGQLWFPYRKDSGTVVTSWSSPEGTMMTPEMADLLTRKFQGLSDLDGDVLTACLVQYMEHHDQDGLTLLDATTILDYRGIEPIKHHDGKVTRRAGHRTEDIREIAASMDRLTCLHIDLQHVEVWETIEGKKSKARNYITHKSKVLLVEEWWEQTTVLRTNGFPVRWGFRIGAWLVPFLQGSRQTAQFLQKILEYDPYRETWEKRLGRYLTFQFRIVAKDNAPLRRNIDTLLSECWLPVDASNPQRTKDRLARALNRLAADGVIGGWTDELEHGKNPALPARKWLPTWKNWTIAFTPPQETSMRYKNAGEKHRALRAQEAARLAKPKRVGSKVPSGPE